VFRSWQLAPGLGGWKDVILNIAVYVPLGLLAALKLRGRPALVRIVLPLLLCSGLSIFVECVQVYDATRFPSAVDVITNTTGAVLGIATALLVPHWFLGPLRWAGTRVRRAPAASLLTAAWVASWTFPWVPLLSLWGWRDKLLRFVDGPWPFVVLLSTAVVWLAFGLLLREVSRAHAMMAMLLSVLVVPGQILVYMRQPLLVEWAGSLCGLALFLAVRNHPSRWQVAAASFTGAVMLRGLAPFHFSLSAARFEWVPLVAILNADRQRAILVLLEKCAWYGTAVWLLERAGFRRSVATACVAAMLVFLEVAQVWLPGRTPDSTDPLIALAMTALFVWVERWAVIHQPEYAGSAIQRTR
jgi:VanZ family protein